MPTATAAFRATRATYATLALALAGVLTSNAASAQDVPAGPPKAWEATAGVGLSLTSGNSDTVNYNLAFDLTRTPGARNVMKWTGLYLRGKQDDALIVNRTSLGYRNEYTLTGRTFLFGQVDYLRDTFKLIDYLVAPTAGMGFKFVDTEPTKFSIDVGIGSAWEKNPSLELRTGGAVSAGERFTHQLTSTASIRQATTGLWKTNDAADGLYTFSIGLTTRISERVQLSIDLLDTYKNKPPTADTEKNDVAFVTAVTSKF